MCISMGCGDIATLPEEVIARRGGEEVGVTRPSRTGAPTECRGTTAAVERGRSALGDLAERDVPLAPYTTYRLGGPAALFVRARTIDDLAAVAAAPMASGLPVLVVGRGSNLLVADDGFRGIAVLATALGGDLDDPRPTVAMRSSVRGGSGLALPVVARRLAAAGSARVRVGGRRSRSLGGAVRMNAGGHGSDMAACLVAAHVFDLRVRPIARGGPSTSSGCGSAPRDSRRPTSSSR